MRKLTIICSLLSISFLFLQCQENLNGQGRASSDDGTSRESQQESISNKSHEFKTRGYRTCVVPEDDLEITKDTILCRGEYHLDDKNLDGVIKIAQDNVTLDCNGAEIIGDGSGYGIYSTGYSNLTIKNCVLSMYDSIIDIRDSDNSSIINNTVTYYNATGIGYDSVTNSVIANNTIDYEIGEDSDAISLDSVSNISIEDNEMLHNESGSVSVIGSSDHVKIVRNKIYGEYHEQIILYGVPDSDISDNDMIVGEDVCQAIVLDSGCDNSTISYNDIIKLNRNGGIYITIYYSLGSPLPKNVKIFGNTILGGGTGIEVSPIETAGENAKNFMVYDNTISGYGSAMACDVGIDIGSLTDSSFYNNIVDCDVAIESSGSNSNVTFYNNYFDTAIPLQETEKSVLVDVFFNTTKTLGENIIGGPYIGGNFWSTYDGVDTNGDGIGETPFEIKNGLYDYLPLTNNVP